MLLRRKDVFHGRVIDLGLDTVELPDGRHAELELIRHPGGAAVVALNAQRQVCMLRQYRHAAGGWIWEIPAGKLEGEEAPLATAQRELEEEAGLRAGVWTSLGDMLSSPGVFNEVIYLFMAHDLEAVPHNREPHELIEIHWVTFEETLAWACGGEIRDAKSLAGLFRVQAHLQAEEADSSGNK